MITETPTKFITIQVLNLSPKVTLQQLTIFFSYCGTVDMIQILRNKDQSQCAFVTFRQPYAFQTALLLDNTIIADKPICILPASDTLIPITSDEVPKIKREGLVPVVQDAMRTMASKLSAEMLNQKSNIEFILLLEANNKLPNKARELFGRARSAFGALSKHQDT